MPESLGIMMTSLLLAVQSQLGHREGDSGNLWGFGCAYVLRIIIQRTDIYHKEALCFYYLFYEYNRELGNTFLMLIEVRSCL